MFGRLHVDPDGKLDRVQLKKEVMLDCVLLRYMRFGLSPKTSAGRIQVYILGSKAACWQQWMTCFWALSVGGRVHRAESMQTR